MNKQTMAFVVAAIIWATWFFRYDISDFQGLTLDRWTGTVVHPGSNQSFDLSNVEPKKP